MYNIFLILILVYTLLIIIHFILKDIQYPLSTTINYVYSL